MELWDIVFLIGFVTYVAIRGVYDRRANAVEVEVTRTDPRDRALIILVSVGSLLLPVVYLFTPLLNSANYRLPAPVPWIGACVMVLALGLFWRSHVDLGRNWSRTLELRKGHRLVTDGVYRVVRHPMYASIWLFGIAQAMLLQNWIAGFSAVLTFAPMYFLRTPLEERMMLEFFGDQYREYTQRTGSVFPSSRAAN